MTARADRRSLFSPRCLGPSGAGITDCLVIRTSPRWQHKLGMGFLSCLSQHAAFISCSWLNICNYLTTKNGWPPYPYLFFFLSFFFFYHADKKTGRRRLGRSTAEAWNWALISGWILLLLNCSTTVAFSDTVFVTSFAKLLGQHLAEYTSCFTLAGVPASLTFSSVFVVRGTGTSYLSVPDPPPPPPPPPTPTPPPHTSPSLISLMGSVDVKHHERGSLEGRG